MKYLIMFVVFVVAIVGLLWAGDHYVLKPAREQGYAKGKDEATAKLQPQITDLSRQLTIALNANADLDAKFAGLQKDYDAYRTATEAAQARARDALAQETARANANRDEMLRYGKIVARVRSVEDEVIVCRRADTLLSDIIRREIAP